jgi:hypothetical protein
MTDQTALPMIREKGYKFKRLAHASELALAPSAMAIVCRCGETGMVARAATG